MKPLKLALTLTFVLLTSCYSDQPKKLSGQIETIEVTYINWACDCAEYVETKYLENNSDSNSLGDSCIFIEPSKPELTIPENFFTEKHWNKNLRLTGQFYIDKGVPSCYEQKTSEKPTKAKVFRYDKFEYISK